MIQRREKLRFAGKPCKSVGIEGEDVGQNLERDLPIELRVARAIHLAHAAGAEG